MESFTKLVNMVTTEKDQKVISLFANLAGDELQEKSDLAVKLIEQGKTFGRALADAIRDK